MNNFLTSNFSLENLQKQNEISKILETNEKALNYGLTLTNAQAVEIIETKNYILKSYGRIEFGTSIVNKIIDAFCTSPYINQNEYAKIVNELTETFYYIKNETLDEVGDDELIELMQNCFNNSCQGSIELLQGRDLEIFARNIRYNL